MRLPWVRPQAECDALDRRRTKVGMAMVVNELDELTRPTDLRNCSESRANGVAVLFLALAIAAVFGRASGERFVDWDDRINISLNPDLNPPTMETLAKYWRSPQMGMYIPVVYRPGPEWRRFRTGGWPLRMEAHSIPQFFTLSISSVIFSPVSSSGRYSDDSSPYRRGETGPPAPVSLLFALHPLQVEPVAWITGFKDVLSGLFR